MFVRSLITLQQPNRFYVLERSPKRMNFSLAWNGLNTRSITQKRDAFGILALLLDIKLADVLALTLLDAIRCCVKSCDSPTPMSLLAVPAPQHADEGCEAMFPISPVQGRELPSHSLLLHVIEGKLMTGAQPARGNLLRVLVTGNTKWKANMSEVHSRIELM